MTNGTIVIIGAGQGGFQAAASLRQEGHAGPIKLIGAEEVLPYQRPPLSKAFLKEGDSERLLLRPRKFYDDNRIELQLGTSVDAIDRAAKQVRCGSTVIDYAHLILATGTRNVRPPIDGIETALDLRTLADAQILRERLQTPQRIAVIGGGFIGLEFAAVARSLGHDTTVVEAEARLMSRVVSPPISERFLELHRTMGTVVHLGNAATAIDGTSLVLADGTTIPADLVIVATGVRPNDELADAAGLATKDGIVTDAQLRTTDPDISALGDCAVFPDPRTHRPVRLESVQAATDHAKAIAKRLVTGSGDAYAAVPWFWSDQSDRKLQIAGLAEARDSNVIRADGAVFRFSSDRLTAVETVNDARTHMLARRLMAEGRPLVRTALQEVGYDLAALRRSA